MISNKRKTEKRRKRSTDVLKIVQQLPDKCSCILFLWYTVLMPNQLLAVSTPLQMGVVKCTPSLLSSQNKPVMGFVNKDASGHSNIFHQLSVLKSITKTANSVINWHKVIKGSKSNTRKNIPDPASSWACPPSLLSSSPCYKDDHLQLRGPYSSRKDGMKIS
jgi:hypothetical protein